MCDHCGCIVIEESVEVDGGQLVIRADHRDEVEPMNLRLPPTIPAQTGLARELQGIFRSRRPTRAQQSGAEHILTSGDREQLVSAYRHYPGGGRRFLQDLDHYIRNIAATEARRNALWDQYTAALTAGGVSGLRRRPDQANPVAVAEELQMILTSELDAHRRQERFRRIREIIVDVPPDEYQALRDLYHQHYPGGGSQLLDDLDQFIRRRCRTAQTHTQLWGDYTRTLYDAGIEEAQRRFPSVRPIRATADNQDRWQSAWHLHFTTPGGAGYNNRRLALWVLSYWNRIAGSGDLGSLVRDNCQWDIAASGRDFEESFSILSDHEATRQWGVAAGLRYFSRIAAACVGRMAALAAEAEDCICAFESGTYSESSPYRPSEPYRQLNDPWQRLNRAARLPVVRASDGHRLDVYDMLEALREIQRDYWETGACFTTEGTFDSNSPVVDRAVPGWLVRRGRG